MPVSINVLCDIALLLVASGQFGTYVLNQVPDADDDVHDDVPARRPRRRPRRRRSRRAPAAPAARATPSVFVPPEPRPCGNTRQHEPSLTESLNRFLGMLPFHAFNKITKVIETMGLTMDIFRMLVEDSVEHIHNRFPNVDWKELLEVISYEFQNSPHLLSHLTDKIGELIDYQAEQREGEFVPPKPRDRECDIFYDYLSANKEFNKKLQYAGVNKGLLFMVLYNVSGNHLNVRFPTANWIEIYEMFSEHHGLFFPRLTDNQIIKILGMLECMISYQQSR
jgi:hypothetical protein